MTAVGERRVDGAGTHAVLGVAIQYGDAFAVVCIGIEGEGLGLILLNRTTRSVRLTERGEIFLDSCRQVLEDIEGAERRVRGEDAEPRGSQSCPVPFFGSLNVPIEAGCGGSSSLLNYPLWPSLASMPSGGD
jgi:hypothetical protein